MRRRVFGNWVLRYACPARLVVCLVAVAALLNIAFTPVSVSAEAATLRVILSYVPIISTWGPTNANGIVLITYSEGDVRGDFIGLPPLQKDVYHLWLMNSTTGETYRLTQFNSTSDTVPTYVDLALPEAIPNHGWDYVLITVEPASGAGADAGPQRSIVGAIPGTEAETKQFPPVLPQTGQPPADLTRQLSWLLVSNGVIISLLVGGRRLLRHPVQAMPARSEAS